MEKKKMNITTKILIGFCIGIVIGLMLNLFVFSKDENLLKAFMAAGKGSTKDTVGPTLKSFKTETGLTGSNIDLFYFLGLVVAFIGKAFVSLMKVIMVPLVAISLTMGAASIGDVKKLKRIGSKTITFYLTTTGLAVVIGLVMALITNIGKGLSIEASGAFKPKSASPMIDTLLDMVPKNVFDAMATEKMLAIILFFILTGVAITMLGEKTKNIKILLEEANELVLKLVELIMQVAPYGICALILNTIATVGTGILIKLAGFVLVTLIALALHYIIVYQSMLILFTKMNPLKFLKKFSKVMLVAFSTSSSNATIPANLECLTEDFGVAEEISSFTIPLGATINMDGTAIMQGVTAIFLANITGVHLGPSAYIAIILTSILASVGTAGVPGAGMIMLAMVLQQVGIDPLAIGIVFGVDRIIDMFRTVVNIMGDAVCTLVIAKMENEIVDENKFYN